MPVTRQQRVFYKTFSQHGSGTAMVEIEPKDVVLLILCVCDSRSRGSSKLHH